MEYFLHHIKETEIMYSLYSGKEKIPCTLKEYYGSHLPLDKTTYFYCYKQEIIPIKNEL